MSSHWTETEKQKLTEFVEQAKIQGQSPYELSQQVDLGGEKRPANGIFLKLVELGFIEIDESRFRRFERKWEAGFYEKTEWLDVNAGSENISMTKNDSSLKPEPFQYSPEEEQELSKFFRKALDNSASGYWLGVENGPTGLGKTHYMTQEITTAIKDCLTGLRTEKLNILIVAPQHRHLEQIRIDIENYIENNHFNRKEVVLVKAASVVEMAKLQSEYLPSDCPHINSNSKSKRPPEPEEILDEMESLAKNENRNSQIDQRIRDLRKELRRFCIKHIEEMFSKKKNPSECQRCHFMHVGKIMFEHETAKISIAFSTYDKLFFGYDTYEIDYRGKYAHEFFSPWITQKTGTLRPIKNTVILMEESSAGFHIIWKQIQNASLQINLTEYVNHLHGNFLKQIFKTLGTISRNYPKHAQEIDKQKERAEKAIQEIEKLYVQIGENKVYHFKTGQTLQFKGQKTEIEQILQSTEAFFSDLFPKQVIGYKASQIDKYNSIFADIKTYGEHKYTQFKESQRHSVFPLATYYMKLGIEPIVRFFDYFKWFTNDIDKETDYFAIALHNLFYDDNEHSRNKLDYFYKKLRERRLSRKEIENEQAMDILDLFYLRGYEYMAMPYNSMKDEYFIEVHSCYDTPEGMLVSLLNEKLQNRLLLISASAGIESPLNTHNLKWLEKISLEKIGIEPEIRAKDSLKKVIKHKYQERAEPKNIFSQKYYRKNERQEIVIEGVNNKEIKRFLKETLTLSEKWFKERDSQENPFYVIVDFLTELLENKGKPRYALFLCNSIKDAESAIELVKNFFDWTQREKVDLGIESVESLKLTANDFRNSFSAEEDASADEDTEFSREMSKIDKKKSEIIQHLLSNEKPKLFLITAAYNSVAIGANLQLQIPVEKFQNASNTQNLETQNLELYMGSEVKTLRRFAGESPTIDIDLSDIMLGAAKTYIIHDKNYIPAAHILAINSEGFKLLAKGVLTSTDNKNVWKKVSGAVKKTQDFHLAQLDSAMQATGRMDRSFNIPAHSHIYLSQEIAESLQEVEDDKLENLICTKTFERILADILKEVRREAEIRSKDKIGDYMRKLLSLCFDEENPLQESAQTLWQLLRKFFAYHQVLSNETMQEIMQSGKLYQNVHKEIAEILALYQEFKDTSWYREFENFFYELPRSAVKITVKYQETKPQEKTKFIEFAVIETFVRETDDEYRFNRHSLVGKGARKQVCHTYYTKDYKDYPVVTSEDKIWLLKPDMMRDVAVPAFDEEETKRYLKMQGYQVKELPPELFEVADIHIPEQGVLVDNKSYSHETFDKLREEKLPEMVTVARQKLAKAQEVSKQDNLRLVYVMRNWWGSLYDRMESFYIRRNTTEPTDKKDEDFDVALLTTHRNQDFTRLNELLERVRKLNFSIKEDINEDENTDESGI